MCRRPETLRLSKEHRPRAPALWVHFSRTDEPSKLCQMECRDSRQEGLVETVQGCPTPKYIPYSVNGAKFVSVIRGQGERQKPMDVEANSHGKVVGMVIIKAKVTAHIACAPSLMSQELTTIFHTEVASTGCRREEQEIQVH